MSEKKKQSLAECPALRFNRKTPRIKAVHFQPVVLFQTQRSTHIRPRAVPLVLKAVDDKGRKPSFQRRMCSRVLWLFQVFVVFLLGCVGSVAADETTNAPKPAPIAPTVSTTPAISTNSTPIATVVPVAPAAAVIRATATNAPDVAKTPATSTPARIDVDTNDMLAPEMGQLPILNGIKTTAAPVTNQAAQIQQLQLLLDLGRKQRKEKDLKTAAETLATLLETNAPTEFNRAALFEMALVAQDGEQYVRAQQIFSQYLHIYANDPSVPEVLLRQGLIYRQMGVNTLAISKFYAVMSTALKLKLDNMDYYKKLVLEAQVEIADTYYLEGNYAESGDFFNRLIKCGAPELDQSQLQFKLIRSLSFQTNHSDTVAHAQIFLDLYTNSSDVPEVRFLLASALKKLGRNHEAMRQVLLLLQSQEDNVKKNPETWIYWQQRAGNDIANQLYKEGDNLNALEIYLGLADLDHSPAWQLPVWYQSGLVYEQLKQLPKANEMYQRIIDRQKELTDSNSTPSLQSLIEMAKWRKDYLDWTQKAQTTNLAFLPAGTNNPAAPVLK